MRLKKIKRLAFVAATLATIGIVCGMASMAMVPPEQVGTFREIHATVMVESPAEVVDLRKNPEKEPKTEEIAPVQYEPVYVAPGITEEDAVLIYYCIEAECGNQSELGKRLATDVIINRMYDEDWPNTIYGVISEKNQFSVWKSGAIFKVAPSEETIAAVNMELEERISEEVVYFNAIGYTYGTPYEKVGAHYFSTK